MSKVEMPAGAELKNRRKKKSKSRWWLWLLVDLAVVAIICALLLFRPGRYSRPETAHNGRVSPYLTHELLPALYNGTQRAEPFELIVTQKGINDIVARAGWPRQSEDTRLSAPEVLFVPDGLVLMATAVTRAVEFVVTIEVEPALDQEGLLNLHLAKVRIGAMNITPVAKVLAKRMYLERLAEVDVDTEDIRTRIAGALLEDEAFEPVFEIEDKKVRVETMAVLEGKLVLGLVPVAD